MGEKPVSVVNGMGDPATEAGLCPSARGVAAVATGLAYWTLRETDTRVFSVRQFQQPRV